MPVNSVTGIDAEVDRFVIWRESTSQYTNMHATWPRLDGGPIEGANPDYQYFKKIPLSPPDVDHRYNVNTTFSRVPSTPAAPEGHPVGNYVASHDTVKLSVAELKIQIETEFQRQVTIAIPATSVPSQLAAAIDSIARKQDGAVLTDKQQAKKDNAKVIGDQIAQLEARRDELFAAVDAGQDYDITVWPAV